MRYSFNGHRCYQRFPSSNANRRSRKGKRLSQSTARLQSPSSASHAPHPTLHRSTTQLCLTRHQPGFALLVGANLHDTSPLVHAAAQFSMATRILLEPHMYKYEPLPPAESGSIPFRLLTLLPAKSTFSPLAGSLQNTGYTLDQIPAAAGSSSALSDFEALSYTWGDQTIVGRILLPENAFLPIASNLDTFLRHRRDAEKSVALWIDALCIDQHSNQEKNSQVRLMTVIYSGAPRLTIWLGPSLDDSDLAMEKMKEMGGGTAFEKLPAYERRVVDAVSNLMNRAWWKRVWIVQELCCGTLGSKLMTAVVRCGSKSIKWHTLVVACARMGLNEDMSRQYFSGVQNALVLDSVMLQSTSKDGPPIGPVEYPSYLLNFVARFRNFHASDPKDKLYALVQYALIRFTKLEWTPDAAVDISEPPSLQVDYNMSVPEVYTYFALLCIVKSNSLEILRHGGGGYSHTLSSEKQYSWVPDWSINNHPTPLPVQMHPEPKSIPWWGVPVKQGDGSIGYAIEAVTRKQAAIEVLKKRTKVRFGHIPERFFDAMSPNMARQIHQLIKELTDPSDTRLIIATVEDGDIMEGEAISLDEQGKRTMERNETKRQCDFLEPLVRDRVTTLGPSLYSAAGRHIPEINFLADSLEVKGILVETISDIHEHFVEGLESDWKKSTRFLVSIGECKKAALESVRASRRYTSVLERSLAFWSTIFVGQPLPKGDHVESWLPSIPEAWTVNRPPLTALHPGQLELLESRRLLKQAIGPVPDGTLYRFSGIEEFEISHESDTLEHPEWTSEERITYRAEFDEMGALWARQPYDLYYRPFDLPFVVPDPYWDCRRKWDEVARKESFKHRNETFVAGLAGPTRERREESRRRMTEEIKKEPSMVPRSLSNAGIEKYALGRRFFFTESGRYGLGPRDTQDGDVIVIIFGLPVPFVLRKVEDGHYQVVGESYVHGIMKGEMIEQYELGMQEMRTIKLC
jgi:hypothetical protein